MYYKINRSLDQTIMSLKSILGLPSILSISTLFLLYLKKKQLLMVNEFKNNGTTFVEVHLSLHCSSGLIMYS